jgi:hypothetical protein
MPRDAPVIKTDFPAAELDGLVGEMGEYMARCMVGVNWVDRVTASISEAWFDIVSI